MNTFRISKYEPQFRQNNRYLKDEWTDYSDIGKMFNGIPLTEREYFSTEKQYISCLINILESAKVESISIESLEDYDKTIWYNKQRLTMENIPEIIRDCLRNKCWCRLEGDGAYIHFGYDYYVYLGIELPYIVTESICRRYKLFCELFQSPYRKD